MGDDAHGENLITEGSNIWEAEKKWFQMRITELESEMAEMKYRRAEDLKGNERALLIFAAKEEAWKLEKKQLLQQLEFQRFHNNEDIQNKADSVAEPSGKVINYSRYVAELKRQKEKVEIMLRNSVAEMEKWKLKAKEKRHVDAALRSVTDEIMRLQKEIEEKNAFILSQMSNKNRIGFGDSVRQAELGAKGKSLSNPQSRLRNYNDGEGSRGREAEKWKRLYLGLKFELDNLQIYKGNPLRDNEDHTAGESGRSRRLDGNLDRTHSEEIGRFKRESPAKGKKNEELGKQRINREKKIWKREKEIKIQGRNPSIKVGNGFMCSHIQPYRDQRIQRENKKGQQKKEQRTFTAEL